MVTRAQEMSSRRPMGPARAPRMSANSSPARTFVDPESGAEVSNPLVIHHFPCPDGFAAALCAWRHFAGTGDYVGITHGQEVPDVTGRDVYLLDIAFELDVMERLSSQARRLVVLDHHKSASDKLHGFKCRCGMVRFDLTKSAARLAWDYFNPGQPVPPLIAHVEDRDLMQWLIDKSPAYLLSLDSGPYLFARWNGILGMPQHKFEQFMARGEAMYLLHRKQVEQIASEARPIVIEGQSGLLANAPYTLHTDVGLELARRCGSFGAVWCLEAHGEGQRVRVGLRAVPGFDCIPLAQAFGGGGHPNASAFRLELTQLIDLVQGYLSATHIADRA